MNRDMRGKQAAAERRSHMSHPRPPGARGASLEDDRLLEAAAAGSQQAFAQLVECHSPWLLNRISRIIRDEHLAQDIAQQVWVQLYRSLSTLRREGTLKAWLAQVAHNRCLDELRRKRPLTFSELTANEENEEVFLLPDPDPRPEELLEWHELQESFQTANAMRFGSSSLTSPIA